MLLRLVVSLGLGAWRDDGFFRGRDIFPSALRRPSCPIGRWGAGGLAWGRRGSARAVVEEANEGNTRSNAMAEPCCLVYHPNHSNSYLEFCQILPFFVTFCPEPWREAEMKGSSITGLWQILCLCCFILFVQISMMVSNHKS